MYDIDFINSTAPTAQTDSFADDFPSISQSSQVDDIGGLCVYTRGAEVVAVWDYENECAWVK